MSEEELIEELSSLFNDIENDERYTDTIYRNITNLQQENKQLKEQLEYLRSNEYLNQVKWERNFNEELVKDLQQENKQLKERNKEIYDGFIVAIDEVCETDREKREYKQKIDKAIDYIKSNCEIIRYENYDKIGNVDGAILLKILGDKENE